MSFNPDHTERTSGRYNWLYNNDHLRRVLKAYVEVKKVKRAELARVARVDRAKVSHYFNKKREEEEKPALTNFQIMRMLHYLGIEISLNIKLPFDEQHQSQLRRKN